VVTVNAVSTLASTKAPVWIVGRNYDLGFFILSLAAPLLLWAAFGAGWLTGVAVYAIFQIAFNMPHNVQTWTMSVLDAQDRAKNGRRYAIALGVIVALFAGTIALSPGVVFPVVRDALVYWGYYHLVRQHYGFLRLYERRMAVAGSPVSTLESKAGGRFLDIVSYAPLLIRFRDPELMTIHVAGQSLWIRHPVWPTLVWQGIAAVYGATILAAVVFHVVAMARGRQNLGPRTLLFAAVTICFGLAGIVIKDIVVAIAVVTSFHNLQYLGLVWFHNRTRAEIAERESLPRGDNPPIDWIRSRKFLPYGAMTFLYGIVLILPIAMFPGSLVAQIPITVVVALHYYVDSRLWRFGDHPNLARYLRLKP
jgi:hypothetical protein